MKIETTPPADPVFTLTLSLDELVLITGLVGESYKNYRTANVYDMHGVMGEALNPHVKDVFSTATEAAREVKIK